MTNFVIIHPHKNFSNIKEAYDHLHLAELDTNIIFIIDHLTEQEINNFVEQVNTKIEYSCIMNTCYEKDIIQNINYMSGIEGDQLFIIKNGEITKNIVKFS